MPTAATAALQIDGLVKRYGSMTAVDGLSLAMPRGTVLALLGPNGAGKTSTVEICCGVRIADAGVVRVLGLDPARDARALRPRVGAMPQDGGGYPGARAGELLTLAAAYAREPLDVDVLADALGLMKVWRTSYRRLSGGERQRLSLAMALVARPELVFLDEPTAGLDPAARRTTWEVVAALRRDGGSVVLTTHHMDEAERLADQVVVIDRGQTVARGTPDELTRRAAGGGLRFRTAGSLDVASMTAAVSRWPGRPAVTTEPGGGYVVHAAPDPALIAAVTAECARQDLLIEDLRVSRRTLEDVFLALTDHGRSA
ncbi:MAG: ABC transporter ATP-binding protein [Mycobacteriales bacterium]